MICSNCGKKIPDTAKVCGYCGHRLVVTEPSKKPAGKPTPEPAARVSATQPRADKVTLEVNTPVKKPAFIPKKKWLWIGGTVLLVAGVVIVVLLLLIHPRQVEIPVATNPENQDAPGSAQSIAAPTASDINNILEDASYFPPFLQNKLANPQVLIYENFDHWKNNEWYTSDNVTSVTDGSTVLKMPGTSGLKTYLCSLDFNPNRGILTKIKMADPPFQMEFFIHKNQWNTPVYMRFGGAIYNTDQLETTIWEGLTNELSNIDMDGPLSFKADTWYGLFIGRDRDGNFLISAWELDDPDNQYTGYQTVKQGAWPDGVWHSCFQIGSGTLYVDDFSIISFDGIN